MMKHVALALLADAEAQRDHLERGNADLKRQLYSRRIITNPCRGKEEQTP